MYRQRFGLTGYPLPQGAQGKTFFDKSPGFKKLERAFRRITANEFRHLLRKGRHAQLSRGDHDKLLAYPHRSSRVKLKGMSVGDRSLKTGNSQI